MTTDAPQISVTPKIAAYFLDERGVLLESMQVDIFTAQPTGAVYEHPPEVQAGYTRMWVGGVWTQVLDADVPPVPEIKPAAHHYRKFSSLDMLDLFTAAEQLVVVEATLVSAPVKLWYDRLLAAEFVTYEDPRTEGGLLALVSAGLLSADRKAEIVAAMQPADR